MGATETKPANRLIHETSPYLRQHAHNPVDWYPWGDEALAQARELDKPIFLSIGYSACHWCHVMERESFEDPKTAELMNAHFINIKVDREERPDLDQIYMSAVQMLTQHGGWPMSVWLTPALEPFHGGTYFPPEPRYGMPSFSQVLLAVAAAWRDRREEVEAGADRLTGHLRELGEVPRSEGSPGGIEEAARQIVPLIDRVNGGIGRAPKFPHSVEMRLLLRAHARSGSDEFRDLVVLSLEKMISGGIYDQVGGGFHRYSTDERWLVPHFEKMLYDNALIPIACLEAYQLTGRETLRRATVETLDYVLREMTSQDGAFHSTQDADSEGVEGKFFVWRKEEILSVLGPEKGEIFCYVYDVTPEGNWEHQNILNMPKPLDQACKLLGRSIEEVTAILAEGKCKLFGERSKRVPPARDDKILTAWNGLMIDTFAVAARVLGKGHYRDAAVRATQFILGRMRTVDGLLLRTYKDGRAKLNAYLDDYACLLQGLVSVYEATFDSNWIVEALALAERMIDQFWDPAEGGFFYTGNDHETMIVRMKDASDNATPSGNAMAAMALARLTKLTGRTDLAEKLERLFAVFGSVLARSPLASAQMWLALDLYRGPTAEIAIITSPNSPDPGPYLEAIYRHFLPNKVVAGKPDGADSGPVALLDYKSAVDGQSAVYLCENFACQRPATTSADLAARLERLHQRAPAQGGSHSSRPT